jgi:endogenous inhibitor of DNA gyrase (YacG/DUF329 family)
MKKNCVICDAEFKNNWALKRHIKRMHTPIECKCCGKHFTKHKSKTKGNFCSAECRKKNKQNWSKEYRQKPERKEAARIAQRKLRAKKKAKDPEWGLKPLVECTCPMCNTTFTQRGTRRKFCSDACSEVSSLQYRENVLKELRKATLERVIEKNCIICDNTYSTLRPHQKFCSKKCRAKHENSQPKHKARKLRWQNEQMKNPNSWHNQPMQLIARRMRGRLRQTLKHRGVKKTNQTFSLVGYTKYELKEHLESQFTDGMSWENMSEWHIDHIRPVSSFNYDSTEHPDFKKCWALNNLQPLWAEDNLRKNNKWDGVVNV